MLNMLAQRRADLEATKDALTVISLYAATAGRWQEAISLANAKGEKRAAETIEKAAQAAVSTGSIGLTNFGHAMGKLMSTSRNIGAFGAVEAAAKRINLRERLVMPMLSVSGVLVAEGAGKPVKYVSWSEQDLTPVKYAHAFAMTQEALQGLTDEALQSLLNLLREADALSGDTALFAALSGNSGEAQGQPTWAGFVDDFQELLRAVAAGAASRLFMILHSEMAKSVAVQALTAGLNIPWNNGTLSGVEILVSDAQTANRATIVDAAGLAIGTTPLEIRVSTQGDMQLDNATTQNSVSVAATSLTSLFQTNTVGIIPERSFTIKAIRPNSFAHLTGFAFPVTDSPIGYGA